MIALHNCEDGSVGVELWDNEAMKTRDAERHPGPWRVMRIESGLIGIIVAIGFLLMGFVSVPVAMWFSWEHSCLEAASPCCSDSAEKNNGVRRSKACPYQCAAHG